MKRVVIAVLLISLGVVAQAVPQASATAQRKIPCKVPENASMCYWTRGRLQRYQGGGLMADVEGRHQAYSVGYQWAV